MAVLVISIRFLGPGLWLRLSVWLGGVSAIGGIPVTKISEFPYIVVVFCLGFIL